MKTLTIILSAILLSLSATGCDTGEDEIFVVPKDYTGYVILIFDQKDGKEPKYKDQKRLYEIPANGILKTQFHPNDGWTSLPEFYRGSISPENRIRFEFEPKNVPADTVVASGAIAGRANKDLAGKEYVRYAKYYVGNKTQSDTAYERAEKLNIVSLSEAP